MMNRKERFLEIYDRTIQRPGAEDLKAFLERSDFFTAPASSKHHLAETGGLIQHSMNVYDRLNQFLGAEYVHESPYTEETIAIVALLHDLCKVNTYKQDWKNQKTYDLEKVSGAYPGNVKHDSRGPYIWESVPAYTIDEKFIYGHGEKSVYIIRSFMDLSPEEATAIRFHMGPWQEGEGRNAGAVFSKNPLAFFLHMADEAATFLDETEGPAT